jgi:hypothetical protein
MLCISVPTVPHPCFWLLSAPPNDYIDEDLHDEDETDASVRASLLPPSSTAANKGHALPQTRKSMAGWDICNMMCLAGGSGMGTSQCGNDRNSDKGCPRIAVRKTRIIAGACLNREKKPNLLESGTGRRPYIIAYNPKHWRSFS